MIAYIPRAIARWLVSRKPQHILLGLPALVVAGLLVGAFVAGSRVGKGRYTKAINAALNAGEIEIANSYAKKLIDSDENVDPSIRYIFLLTTKISPQSADFQDKLHELAPTELIGYGPAHFRVAQVMAAKFKMLDPELVEMLEHHLRAAIIERTEVSAANLMLGHLYQNSRRNEAAKECFEIAAKDNIDGVLALARLFRSAGKQLCGRFQALGR